MVRVVEEEVAGRLVTGAPKGGRDARKADPLHTLDVFESDGPLTLQVADAAIDPGV